MKNSVLAFLACLVLLSQVGFGGVVPNRWDKIDVLPEGTEIIIKMEGGERLECEYLYSDAERLVIRDFDEIERELPKSGIKKIQTLDKTGKNQVWDGALIGGAIGAAAMGITAAAIETDDKSGAGLAVLWGAGIGAAIGFGVDGAIGARETLFESK